MEPNASYSGEDMKVFLYYPDGTERSYDNANMSLSFNIKDNEILNGEVRINHPEFKAVVPIKEIIRYATLRNR
jgi:hypothetical protein